MFRQIMLILLLLAVSLLPVSTNVHAQEDTLGPILHRVWVVPTRINTTNGSQAITFYFEVTDDLSGFSGSMDIVMTLQSEIQYGCQAAITEQENVYSCTNNTARHAEFGQQYIEVVRVRDNAGNESLSRRTVLVLGEVRQGICNSGQMEYAECADWLDAIILTNDPDFTPASKQYLPFVKAKTEF